MSEIFGTSSSFAYLCHFERHLATSSRQEDIKKIHYVLKTNNLARAAVVQTDDLQAPFQSYWVFS